MLKELNDLGEKIKYPTPKWTPVDLETMLKLRIEDAIRKKQAFVHKKLLLFPEFLNKVKECNHIVPIRDD